MRTTLVCILLVVGVTLTGCGSRRDTSQQSTNTPTSAELDLLPSWHEGPAKKAIVDFVARTTTAGSSDFIPAPDRIACFDNDGTLWSEQPAYFQFLFALDRIKSLSAEHPEWKTQEPFKSVLAGDMQNALRGGEHALLEMIMATHAGLTVNEFDQTVRGWLADSRHPTTGKRYTDMTYKPMRELLDFLRAHDFQIFIVSGGGVDFLRVWSKETYGIPENYVIGSSGKVKYELRDGVPVLVKLPEINFINDKAGKPVAIHQYIGKVPVFTVGNSDGDYEMLEYTTTATGYPRFGMIIHHTDSVREWAYDRASAIGKLSRGLDDATRQNWRVVDMQHDWKEIF
ncbi:MAG: HAD family hydrolase [Cyclobacteriaceae bacterium]|jgi:phosphoserine phosphatase